MNKTLAQLLIYEMYYNTDRDGVLLVPGFDMSASYGEVVDTGRIIRCELDWDEEKSSAAAVEFGNLAEALIEIGNWYSNSGEQYGIKPDADFMVNPISMDVWAKYISGYKEFDTSPEGISEYSRLRGLTGYAGDLLIFMINHCCRLSALDVPEEVLDLDFHDLAAAFVLYRFAKKAERIDILMDEREDRSYFPECKHMTLEDFKRIAFFLNDENHIETDKACIFFEKTRFDKDTEKLYNELLNMDM